MGFTEETSSPAPVFTIASSVSNKSHDVAESMNDRTNSDPGERNGHCKKDEPDSMTCWQKIRHSTNTSTFLVFLILFLDGLLLTSIEPVLPHIIGGLDDVPQFLQDDKLKTLQNKTKDFSAHTMGQKSSIAVGVIFAAKPLSEFIANPLIGWAVDRYGYKVPLIAGYFVTITSALGLAFSDTYLLLFIARCFQGLGGPLLVISGLVFLSSIHGDTPERSTALALVFIGPGAGSIVGFPYGSSVYQFLGRIYPYVILAVLIFAVFLFHLFYKPAKLHQPKDKMSITAYLKICIDPYIMVAVVTWINISIAVSSALLAIPLFVTEKFNAEPYEIGLSMLIIMVPCATTQAVLAKFTQRLGWWKLCLVGGSVMPFLFVIYPFVPSFWLLSAPNVLGGVGLGIFLSSFHAQLCHIGDIRFGPNYGATFSLNKLGYGIGMLTGSMVMSVLINQYGYTTSFISVAIFVLLVNSVVIILRKVPNKQANLSSENII